MSKDLKSVGIMYGITLGILLAMLVGFGITGFYKCSDYYGASDYARNVFLIAFACGMIFSVAGLLLPRRVDVFRLGLLLGGLFTLLFSVIYPASEGLGMGWIFGAVAIALIILVPIGYLTLTSRERNDNEFE